MLDVSHSDKPRENTASGILEERDQTRYMTYANTNFTCVHHVKQIAVKFHLHKTNLWKPFSKEIWPVFAASGSIFQTLGTDKMWHMPKLLASHFPIPDCQGGQREYHEVLKSVLMLIAASWDRGSGWESSQYVYIQINEKRSEPWKWILPLTAKETSFELTTQTVVVRQGSVNEAASPAYYTTHDWPLQNAPMWLATGLAHRSYFLLPWLKQVEHGSYFQIKINTN